jgi:hypothetical protein
MTEISAEPLAKLACASSAGAPFQRAPAATDPLQPFYSEYAINPREVLRAEICSIKGRSVVRFSRWKRTAAGNEKRTGCAFEFGAHHCSAVVALLSDIERKLGGLPNGAA